MNEKHTPGKMFMKEMEPDYLDGIQSGLTLYREGKHESRNVGDRIVIAYGFDSEEFRRISACVNACTGISTESLEAGCVAEMKFFVRQIMNDLPTKRDWLDPAIEELGRDLLAMMEQDGEAKP